ncbi:uncharacterized protein LOC110357952 [Columba livia]|uniref:uncharacterized protein LOC110357952 n=1 Tax=Columba livia TaxID=8932 RepID=UPI0031B9C17B
MYNSGIFHYAHFCGYHGYVEENLRKSYDISASRRPVSDDGKSGSTVLASLLAPLLLPAHISQRSCPRGGGASGRGSARGGRCRSARGCGGRRPLRPNSPPHYDARSGSGAGSRRSPPKLQSRLGPATRLLALLSKPDAHMAAVKLLAAGPAGIAASPCSGCFGTGGQSPTGAASARGGGCAPCGVRPSVRPSVHPSIHPYLRGRWLVCACVSVTDSAARTARGQLPSRNQPGTMPARPGCGSHFSVPRSPPLRGRPQRPRCSSSSLLAVQTSLMSTCNISMLPGTQNTGRCNYSNRLNCKRSLSGITENLRQLAVIS